MDSGELKGFTSYWRIENFLPRSSKPNLALESPKFKENIFDSEWILYLEQNDTSYLGVYICKMKNSKIISMHYSIALLTRTGWLPVLKKAKKEFVAEDEGWGVHKFLSWKKISKEDWTYLPHGSLTVKFHLWNGGLKTKPAQCLMVSRMSGDMKLKHLPVQTFDNLKPSDLLSFPISYEMKIRKKFEAESYETAKNRSIEHLEDLIVIFREKKFSFVTLRSINKDFIVHKAVLSAKSPVFRAMFDSDTKENNISVVEIDDIDSDTLSSFLQLLHLEPIDLNWDAALKLYYAADKYQIEALKKTCVSQLKRNFSDENICDAFILADLYHDEDLKKNAHEYFCNHSKSILLSQNWKDLLLTKTK